MKEERDSRKKRPRAVGSRAPACEHELFETCDAPMLLFDPESGRVVDANPAATHFYNLARAEFSRLRIDDLCPEARAGRPSTATAERRVEVALGSLTVAGQSLRCAIVHDLTPHRQSEDALRRERDLARQYLDVASVLMVGLDATGRITLINHRGHTLMGYDERDMLGRDWFDLCMPAEVREEARSRYRRFIDGETDLPEYFETPVLTAAGDRRTLAFHRSILRDPHDRALGVVASGEDITERARTQGQVRLLATAIEQAGEAIFITDPGGVIQYVNPAFERVCGYSAAEAIGRTPRILKSGKHDDAFYGDLWSRISRGEVWTGRFTNKRKDGALYVKDATISPVFDTEGAIVSFVSVGRDVTHEVELQSQFRHAQKMEAIGTLAGGIAHDFNNILYAIIGFTECALADIPAATQTRRCLDEVLKAGRRATELVSQILAFSRQAEQERRPVFVQLVIKEALKLLRGSLPATIEIRQEIPEDCGPVLADPTQIHQVVMNLCTNAYHAMRERGGVLDVSLREIQLRVPVVVPADLSVGRHIRLRVKDTGHGMDQQLIDRIFEPYFTTKKQGEGTGLGLATVHGIVKAHGGVIHVESEPGRGSAFDVYLPVFAQPVADVEPQDSLRSAPRGSERILFVDDEESLAEVVKIALERLGYKVTACVSSSKALTVFRARPRTFDLVITDQTMPGMTGLELSAEILKARPELPVILCTGFSDVVTEESARAAGIRKYLRKPIVQTELARAIREVLDDEPAP